MKQPTQQKNQDKTISTEPQIRCKTSTRNPLERN